MAHEVSISTEIIETRFVVIEGISHVRVNLELRNEAGEILALIAVDVPTTEVLVHDAA